MLGSGGTGLFGNLSAPGGTAAPNAGSNAAPGGLFGTTTSASGAGAAPGIFGNTSSGSLFGAPATGAPVTVGAAASGTQPQGGALFGSGTSNSTHPVGGLFGGGASGTGTTSSSAPSGTGLFGAGSATAGASTNSGSSGSGLFGTGAGITGTDKGTNSLFGPGSSTSGGGGLFGSTTAAGGNSQNASQPSLLGGTSGTATGASETGKGGLFGATTAAAKQQEPAKPGGLFGGLSATNSATEPPKGGLFGNSSTVSTTTSKPDTAPGALFGAPTAAPKEPNHLGGGLFGGKPSSVPPSGPGTLGGGSAGSSGGADVLKGTGLFGSQGDAPKQASSGGLFGTSSSAAGGVGAGADGKGSGLLAATPAASAAASQQSKPAEQTGTTSGVSLFGTGASGTSSSVGVLTSNSAKTTVEPKDGQKGSDAAAPSSSLPLASERKTGQSLLGGSGILGAPATAPAAGTLFGTKPESSAVTNNAVATTQPSTSGPVLPPEEVALETMQHERMDDLLTNWERRLQRKVGQFDELAQEVAAVEASLITQSKALAGIREEQQRVHRRQLFVGETIDMIEQQQNDLSNLLASIESSLLSKLSPKEQRGICSTVEQSMSQRVLDIDMQMDELTSAIAQTARRTQPQPVAAVSQVLAVHQAALESATQQCTRLEQSLKNLQRFVA
ncbi:hypothetical protein, conserved [Eimeria tenella]|uniref:Nucleoporin NSP1-like C-terminal domain-containing protein n=1 Tax=Eimeria tenella TaxID=5802 RepID=U6L6Q8_EIMTE|nr:hypothetical protein, conserved [Eimeria tenella]CDJ43450.1 hypothetical protein, conserved [Eimeria tenella]|eukprot:XP_013234200.1 hypothetical protein, conserved [Eimeria tenella]